MKLFIKNMVCNRCIMVVQNQLSSLGYKIKNIKLGEVDLFEENVSNENIEEIKDNLFNLGFELIDDKKSKLIEQIKTLILESIYLNEEFIPTNYSNYISDKLGYEYNYLSTLFSNFEGITLEKYIINLKIERIKELIIYDELNLNEISYKMGYSSVAYLSNQFKKVTGLSPSHFKKIKDNKRKFLDKI